MTQVCAIRLLFIKKIHIKRYKRKVQYFYGYIRKRNCHIVTYKLTKVRYVHFVKGYEKKFTNIFKQWSLCTLCYKTNSYSQHLIITKPRLKKGLTYMYIYKISNYIR